MVSLKLGVIFPTLDVLDPIGIRDVAQAAEALGFSHLVAWEHVAGADVTHRRDWDGVSTLQPIHEPLVLFGYVAAVTRRLELVTGVLVLPQRQTVLVAKQAAEVDILSGGRLRLGVGVGWVEPEFRALNAGWTDRGRRSEEQIEVLRALWTREVVTFHGNWHHVQDMGISPLPMQRPIPIWIGGQADVSLRRVAAIGDGWMAPVSPVEVEQGRYVERLHRYARAAGRDPSEVGIEAIVSVAEDLHPEGSPRLRSPEQWKDDVETWRTLGATHVSFNSTGAGQSAQGHINAMERFIAVLR
jgi:probable F420-dependent oxidoreductase